jgi:hypothetical protein
MTRSVIAWRVGRFRQHVLNAGVVVGRIQPSELSNRPVDHGFDLCIVRDVTGDSQGFVASVGQRPRGRPHCLLAPIRQHHRGAGLGKCMGGRETQSGGSAGDQRNPVFE